MKIKRSNHKNIFAGLLDRLHPRKKKLSVMEELRQEQARLLIHNNNFYVQEAYKSLRTNVLFSLTEESESNVIQVTSSMPSEGKSTTSANLAISFAEMGKKTILIDCDMRKPKLSRLLKMKSSKGLSNVLLHPKQWKEAVLDVGVENLYAMTAGDIPPNPSELLGSKRMKELVTTLRQNFDFVILDTPPVNVVTDAVILSPVTDGTLMVVRSGQSERGAVRRAVNQLERTNTKLLGFVLNGVSQEGHAYGSYRNKGYYKQGDGYGYGYGYQHSGSESGFETDLTDAEA